MSILIVPISHKFSIVFDVMVPLSRIFFIFTSNAKERKNSTLSFRIISQHFYFIVSIFSLLKIYENLKKNSTNCLDK